MYQNFKSINLSESGPSRPGGAPRTQPFITTKDHFSPLSLIFLISMKKAVKTPHLNRILGKATLTFFLIVVPDGYSSTIKGKKKKSVKNNFKPVLQTWIPFVLQNSVLSIKKKYLLAIYPYLGWRKDNSRYFSHYFAAYTENYVVFATSQTIMFSAVYKSFYYYFWFSKVLHLANALRNRQLNIIRHIVSPHKADDLERHQ